MYYVLGVLLHTLSSTDATSLTTGGCFSQAFSRGGGASSYLGWRSGETLRLGGRSSSLCLLGLFRLHVSTDLGGGGGLNSVSSWVLKINCKYYYYHLMNIFYIIKKLYQNNSSKIIYFILNWFIEQIGGQLKKGN